MNIAIAGNRRGWTYDYIREKLIENNITKHDLIISGGSMGVDTYAQDFAREIGASILIIYPDLTRNDEGPASIKWYTERYFARNMAVVDKADRLIAFNKQEHSGTLHTINYAKSKGKEVIVYDGLE